MIVYPWTGLRRSTILQTHFGYSANAKAVPPACRKLSSRVAQLLKNVRAIVFLWIGLRLRTASVTLYSGLASEKVVTVV